MESLPVTRSEPMADGVLRWTTHCEDGSRSGHAVSPRAEMSLNHTAELNLVRRYRSARAAAIY